MAFPPSPSSLPAVVEEAVHHVSIQSQQPSSSFLGLCKAVGRAIIMIGKALVRYADENQATLAPVLVEASPPRVRRRGRK